MGTTGVNLLYLVTIVCFVLALRFLSSPATARRGNQIGAVGMVIAIVATLLKASVHITWLMVLGAVDRRRVRCRRRAAREDDRDAADGGAVQRRRRRRGGARRAGGVPRAGAASGPHPRRRLARDPALGADRLHLVLGLARRVREAAGADQGPADRLSRPEARQRAPDRRLHRSGRAILAGGEQQLAALGGGRRGAPLRRPLRAADRRRRHAGRDLAAERVHRARRGGDGLRAREQRADRQRHARRRRRERC